MTMGCGGESFERCHHAQCDDYVFVSCDDGMRGMEVARANFVFLLYILALPILVQWFSRISEDSD